MSAPAKIDESTRVRAEAMLLAGKGSTEIARSLNMKPSTVSGMKIRMGLSGRRADLIRHGTQTRYRKGCRCAPCTEAHAARRAIEARAARQRRAARVEPVEHGVTGYGNYGCRCAVCRAAASAAHWEWTQSRRSTESIAHNRELAERWRRAHQARSRQEASRHGYLWTGPELELISRRELTVRELAALLGRTMAAVSSQRHLLLAGDPKKTRLAGISRDTPDPVT